MTCDASREPRCHRPCAEGGVEALTVALKRGDDPPIAGSYKSRGIQKVLRDTMFEGLCCFCECETELGNYGQVEHYRPKGARRVQAPRVHLGEPLVGVRSMQRPQGR